MGLFAPEFVVQKKVTLIKDIMDFPPPLHLVMRLLGSSSAVLFEL